MKIIKKYFHPFVFLLVILALIVAHYTQLNRTYSWIYYAGLSSSLLVFCLSIFAFKYSLFAVGVGICTLPFLGAGHLNFFISFWLLGSVFRASKKDKAISPTIFLVSSCLLLVPFFLGALFTFLKHADPLLLETILSGGGLYNLNIYLAKGHFAWHQAWLIFFGYLAMLLAVKEFYDSKAMLDYLIKGLAAGSLICCLVLLCQWFELHRWLSFNRDAFWVFTKRYEGTFSDPNALGLMSVFLIPLFLYEFYKKRGFLYLTAALGLLAVLPLSGSRSAFLGLAIFLIVFSLRGSQKKLKTLFFSTLIFISFTLLLSVPKINLELQKHSPAVSFTRMLKTLNRDSAKESLSSRVIMGQIALEMWKESPLVGVGSNRFYGLQSHVAKRNGIKLGTWRDNANNYYLQILSELGAFGLILVMLSFYALYRIVRESQDENDRNFYPLWLFAFAILLLTGPHLFFDELRYLFSIIIVLSIGSKKVSSKNLWFLILPGVAISIAYLFVSFSLVERKNLEGFWGREDKVIWSGRKARFIICPNPLEPEKIFVKTLHPDLPVTFTVSYRGGKALKLHAVTNEWLELPMVMPLTGTVELVVDKLWSPPNDPRWLGMQLIIPENLCENKIQ